MAGYSTATKMSTNFPSAWPLGSACPLMAVRASTATVVVLHRVGMERQASAGMPDP